MKKKRREEMQKEEMKEWEEKEKQEWKKVERYIRKVGEGLGRNENDSKKKTKRKL
jgi:hypothetical protein